MLNKGSRLYCNKIVDLVFCTAIVLDKELLWKRGKCFRYGKIYFNS